MSKIGRNDLCPCGSGKKYKKCHEAVQRNGTVQSRVLMIIIGAVILAAVAAGVAQFSSDHTANTGTGVWDPAHGHYH